MTSIDELCELPDLPDAKCKGVEYADVFFPRAHDMNFRIATAQAEALCNGCPERVPCLEWALTHKVDGIWAGTDEGDRKRMMRKARA
jgi:WhiB family transcriptional regulator, redox-sensing transcriptional regulator